MSVTRTAHKDIASLLTKKGRKAHRQFLAEGVRLLEEAIRHRQRPLAVYWCPAMLAERGRALVDNFARMKVEMVELSARQMAALSDTEAPQGIAARFVVPTLAPSELIVPSHRRVLVCEHIGDPGNVGTLLRSALAFEFADVALVGSSAEPFAPKVVRASSGALFGLRVATGPLAPFLEAASETGAAIVAADVRGTTDRKELRGLAQSRPIVLAIGSESDGLSPELLERATLRVRIGHAATVESLNAAVAGSILMSEIYYRDRGKTT